MAYVLAGIAIFEKLYRMSQALVALKTNTMITMIKMIETGIRGTHDPDTTQPAKIDGMVVAVLVTTLEVTILLGIAIEPLSTDEPIALARSVDRPRRAAIVNRRVADAIST